VSFGGRYQDKKMADDSLVPKLSYSQIRLTAWKLRKEAGVWNEDNFNLVPILENFFRKKISGYELYVEPTDSMGTIEAYVCLAPDPCLFVSQNIYELGWKNVPRARFTLAHEGGHLFLHRQYLSVISEEHAARKQDTKGQRHRLIRPSVSMEAQANYFAAEFLWPEHIVRRYRSPTEMSRCCGASLEAAQFRMLDLGLWKPKSDVVMKGFEQLLRTLRESTRIK
jgi:hypothetical protein